MRKPSSGRDLYAWHTAAMAGENPSVVESLPECGWYQYQFKKGGPWLGVEIRISREIDPDTGELACPEIPYAFYLDQPHSDVLRLWVWLANRPISRDRYKTMIASQYDSHILTSSGRADLTMEPARP